MMTTPGATRVDARALRDGLVALAQREITQALQVALLTEQYTLTEIERATGMTVGEIKAARARLERIAESIDRDDGK